MIWYVLLSRHNHFFSHCFLVLNIVDRSTYCIHDHPVSASGELCDTISLIAICLGQTMNTIALGAVLHVVVFGTDIVCT